MDALEYQELSKRTLLDFPGFQLDDDDIMIVWAAVGLAGEAGEVMENVKHGIFHRRGLRMDEMKDEIGDCLWYLSALCTKLGFTLSEVMERNISKLKVRYPNGYITQDTKKGD